MDNLKGKRIHKNDDGSLVLVNKKQKPKTDLKLKNKIRKKLKKRK